MKSGKTSDNAIEHVGKYIDNRLAGANKQQSALLADYSETTATVPSLIENTQAYAVIMQEMLRDNSVIMRVLTQSLRNDLANGALDNLKPMEKAQILKIQAQVEDILRPKITVKETTDSKGNKVRTLWGTNASTLNETLNNKE